MIAVDDDIKKIQGLISTGMQANANNLQNYLGTWDNYREIWEINKDAFIKRYNKLNPQVTSFDADIARLDYSVMLTFGLFPALGVAVSHSFVAGISKAISNFNWGKN